MRVHKRGYTIPIPKGAKRLKRKDGVYVKYVRKGNEVTAKLTQKGDRVLLESKNWYIDFEDNLQRPQCIKAFTNEQASRQLADKIQQLLNYRATDTPLDNELMRFVESMPSNIRRELIEIGVTDSPEEKRSMKLDSLVAEYEEWLEASKYKHGYKRSGGHRKTTRLRIRKIIKNCGFVNWEDIKASEVEKYLGKLKIAPGTYNGYVSMFKTFCRWVVDNEYADKSPVERGIALLSDDKESDKVGFTAEEVKRLIEAAENGPRHHGTDNHERSVLYLFAAESGLRIKETISKLTVGDFDLDRAFVNIRPEINKNRKGHKVYLRRDKNRCEQFREHFRGKHPAAKAFRIGAEGIERAAEMVREDLKNTAIRDASGNIVIPAIAPYDENGKKRCFHSFRRTMDTEIKNICHDDLITKIILGHKIPKTDMTARYYDIKEEQIREIVEQLPDWEWPEKREAMAATGTDGRPIDEILSKSYRQDAHEGKPKELDGISGGRNEDKMSRQAKNRGVHCFHIV